MKQTISMDANNSSVSTRWWETCLLNIIFFEFQHADKKKQRAIFCIWCCQHWIQCCFCAITVLFLWRIFCSASKMTSKYPCSLVRNTQEQHGNCFMAILSYWHSGRETSKPPSLSVASKTLQLPMYCHGFARACHPTFALQFPMPRWFGGYIEDVTQPKKNVATVQNCSFFLCIDWARLHGQTSWQ